MIIALVIVIGGVVLVTSSSDDDEAEDNTANTSQQAEESTDAAAEEAGSTIVDLAVATDSLSTLVAAVTAADLVETLSGDGPFTVFAPTNDAFAALPEGTLDDLLLPENVDQLTSILTFHVVPAAALSTDLSDGMMLETVNGEMLEVSIADGVVSINGATVVSADIEASNGVVHVIDRVLLPPSLTNPRGEAAH